MYRLAETNLTAKIGKKKYTDTKVSVFFNKKAHFRIIHYFCSIKDIIIMPDSNILSQIQSLGEEIIPAGGHLYLYGSRARGDYRPDSDWDLLILLDKDKEEFSDFDNYSYPFIELGYDLGTTISAHLYTMDKWDEMSFSIFHHNVEQDKIVLV